MNIYLTTLVVALVAIGVKQASFILIHGSVFQYFRDWIEEGMDEGRWVRTKLYELFTCPLCMTTQVAIWTVAVPGVWSAHVLWPHPFEVLLGFQLPASLEVLLAGTAGFLAAMSFGALALAFWEVLEYFPKKTAMQQEYYNRLLRIHADGAVDSSHSTVVVGASTNGATVMTFVDFWGVIESIDRICKRGSIGCGYSRRDCREDALYRTVRDWLESRGHATEVEVVRLADQLSGVLRNFFRYRSRRKSKDQVLEKAEALFRGLQSMQQT